MSTPSNVTSIYEHMARKSAKRAPKSSEAPARVLKPAEVAKHVRAALKATYPTTTFTVRTSTYSGGSSVDVAWQDGPTTADVQALLANYDGRTFNGMDDSTGYKPSFMLKGERVKSYTSVSYNRSYSAKLLRAAAAQVAREYGCPAPEVREESYTDRKGVRHVEPVIDRGGERVKEYETAGDLTWYTASQMRG